MTVQEFHEIRKPFYIDPDSLLVIYPTQKHMDNSHAEWFTDIKYPFVHTIRGYYWKHNEEEFLMIYINDFGIPNMSVHMFMYLFEYFPNIQWIGIGCHIGQPGEIWKPKIKIYREKV